MLAFSHAALALTARPERVWAIGDLHGDAGCARHWVERTRLISNVSAPPEEWVWTDPSAKLVFMGDYIDRGPEARAVLSFVRELTTRFPDSVHALLGNHELNLLVDRARPAGGGRYLEYAYAAAHPAQYAAWLPGGEDEPGSAEVLRALHEALLLVYREGLHGQGVLMTPEGPRSVVQFVRPAAMRPRVAGAIRRWQSAYLRGVGARTPLGAWVQRPLSVVLADTVFVHGGIPEELLDLSVPATRDAPAVRLGAAGGLALLNARWLNASRAARVGALAPRRGESEAEAEAAEARALAGSAKLLHIASEMVEYRGLHDAYAGRYEDRHSRGATPAQVACDRVVALLRRLNVSRIAVGHTPEDSVRVRCGGRLLALDSTLSRSFRAHGNYYCDAHMEREEPRICPPRNEACEGQIVRLERAPADGQVEVPGGAPWLLHVVEAEWDRERDEGAIEDMKMEL